MLDGEGGGIGIEGIEDMELVDRAALLAACKVVAVMLTIRAHASLFDPLTPTRPTYTIAHSIVTAQSTDHIPLHPMGGRPLASVIDWVS